MSNLVINVLKKSCIGHCLTPQLLKTMMTCQVTLCSMHAILQPDCKTKKPQSITKLGCLSNLCVPACNYQNQLMCGYQTPTLCRVFSEKEEVLTYVPYLLIYFLCPVHYSRYFHSSWKFSFSNVLPWFLHTWENRPTMCHSYSRLSSAISCQFHFIIGS